MLTAGGACGHQKGNSNPVFVQGNFCQLVKATLPFLYLFVLWRVAPYARVTRSVRLFSLFFCDHFHCAINSGALSQTDCWFQTLHTSLSPTIHSSLPTLAGQLGPVYISLFSQQHTMKVSAIVVASAALFGCSTLSGAAPLDKQQQFPLSSLQDDPNWPVSNAVVIQDTIEGFYESAVDEILSAQTEELLATLTQTPVHHRINMLRHQASYLLPNEQVHGKNIY